MRNKPFTVKIHLKRESEPITIDNVKTFYIKGSFTCMSLIDKSYLSFPTEDIFKVVRIKELRHPLPDLCEYEIRLKYCDGVVLGGTCHKVIDDGTYVHILYEADGKEYSDSYQIKDVYNKILKSVVS